MAKGRSLQPRPISPASAVSALASKVEAIGGKVLRCNQAVGLPSDPSEAFRYMAATLWNVSNWMSSSRDQTTLTGLPDFFDSTAASTAKSGKDLRPKPPPRRVTLTVTSSFLAPTAAATASRVPCGFCVADQISTLPPSQLASAAGGSMEACASMGA